MAAAPYHKVDDAVAVPVAVPVAAPAGAALPVVPATAVPAAGTVVSVRQGGGTTVVVQQSHGPVHVNYWGYGGGIVDQCCDDEHIFVLGFCCPCVLFGQIAEWSKIWPDSLCLGSCCGACLAFILPSVLVGVLGGIFTMSRILEAMSDFAACNSGPESDAQACAEHLQEVNAISRAMTSPFELAAYIWIGFLAGLARQKLLAKLGGPQESQCLSTCLHLAPILSACALCQEARAAKAFRQASVGNGAVVLPQQPAVAGNLRPYY